MNTAPAAYVVTLPELTAPEGLDHKAYRAWLRREEAARKEALRTELLAQDPTATLAGAETIFPMVVVTASPVGLEALRAKGFHVEPAPSACVGA